MVQAVRVGGKKGRKIGRNLKKCALYRDRKVRLRNKIQRIMKSCGLKYALWWAEENDCIDLYWRYAPPVKKP